MKKGFEILDQIFEIVKERRTAEPENSYTALLYSKGLDAILKKIGEESTEVVMAAKEHSKEKVIYEASDLLYHLLVLLSFTEISPKQIAQELENRQKKNEPKR